MFKWFIDLLVTTPVHTCCESKTQNLRRMQRAIERGEIESEEATIPSENAIVNCDNPENEYVAKILGAYVTGYYPCLVKPQDEEVSLPPEQEDRPL